MKTEVDRLLWEEQAGIRKERSCTDHIATPRVIIEQSLEWNSPLYITFVDFEKAFDSVDGTALWKLLALYGIPEKITLHITTTLLLHINRRLPRMSAVTIPVPAGS